MTSRNSAIAVIAADPYGVRVEILKMPPPSTADSVTSTMHARGAPAAARVVVVFDGGDDWHYCVPLAIYAAC